jgi:ribosomal protein S12 methylthiotransferase accessory factor
MEMTISFPGGKRVDAHLMGRTIQTDQAREAGGDGSAPEPYTLFLSSIGTCAGIYVLGFCPAVGS